MKNLIFIAIVVATLVACNETEKVKIKNAGSVTKIDKTFPIILVGTICFDETKRGHSFGYFFKNRDSLIKLSLIPDYIKKDFIPLKVIKKMTSILKNELKDSTISFHIGRNGDVQFESFVSKENPSDIVAMLIDKIQEKTWWRISKGGFGVEDHSEIVTIPIGGSFCGTLEMTLVEADIFAKKYGYKEIKPGVYNVQPGERFIKTRGQWKPVIW